eukprot:COSAG02_NODE_1113_length_14503_cov_87.812205_3_plen_137_part_00
MLDLRVCFVVLSCVVGETSTGVAAILSTLQPGTGHCNTSKCFYVQPPPCDEPSSCVARWGEEIVDGMSDAQLAVMRGPDRDAADVNVPRLVVSPADGAIGVEYAKGGTLYSNVTPTGPVAKKEAAVAVAANAVAKL